MSRHSSVWLVLILCLSLLTMAVGTSSPRVVMSGGAFVDDDGNVHEPNIDAIAGAAITLGCSVDGNLFCPAELITRAQMASFLARGFDLPAAGADFFSDDTGNHHEDNINRIRAAGITFGCGDGTEFCPSDHMTRGQMASFLARAAGLGAADRDYFVDDGGSVHEDNINRVAYGGITLGCEEFRFCPADYVRRDQMASFLARALGIGTNPGYGILAGVVTDADTGEPIHGVPVSAHRDPMTGATDEYAYAETLPDGSFQFNEIATGNWVVVSGNLTEGMASVWAREWYDDKPDHWQADRIFVNSVQPATIEIELTIGGTISGVVTDEVSGLPVRGVDVAFLIQTPTGIEGLMGAPATAGDGTYTIEGLHTTSYKVCFFPMDVHEAECWDDAKDFGGGIAGTPGDWIPVTAGEAVTGIDAQLTP